MNKIVIIDHEPLSERRRQIFYIDGLRAANFDVEFWDCSQYFHPGMALPDNLTTSYLHKFHTLPQIRETLDRIDIKNTIFVVEVFEIWENHKFFHILSERNCYMVRLEMYASSTLTDISNWGKLFRSTPLKILKVIRNRTKAQFYKLYCKRYGISYSLKISSGNAPDIDIHINHPDWETARKIETSQPVISGHYILFLDELFTLHPDMLFFEGKRVGNTETYHKILTRFFDLLETQYNMPVVIAAHPKSEYPAGTFGNRKIIKYKSTELTYRAQAVFMHSTAALSYIMILDKPVAITVTDDYKKIFELYINVEKIQALTGLPIFNIEQNPAQVEFHHINKQVREKYIYSYLTTPGIENLSNLDILSKTFREL